MQMLSDIFPTSFPWDVEVMDMIVQFTFTEATLIAWEAWNLVSIMLPSQNVDIIR